MTLELQAMPPPNTEPPSPPQAAGLGVTGGSAGSAFPPTAEFQFTVDLSIVTLPSRKCRPRQPRRRRRLDRHRCQRSGRRPRAPLPPKPLLHEMSEVLANTRPV